MKPWEGFMCKKPVNGKTSTKVNITNTTGVYLFPSLNSTGEMENMLPVTACIGKNYPDA